MKAKRSTVFLFLSMALGGLLVFPTSDAGLAATTQGKLEAPPLAPRTIIINELAPINDSPGSEWVELLNQSGGHALYLPLLLRNSRAASAGGWGAPKSGAAPVGQTGGGLDISGWQVGDEDGNDYAIPGALGPVPSGGYVLIRFDGQGPGADDYDFDDGVAVLHSPAGQVDIFDDKADQVALYTDAKQETDTLHDFVAYGAPSGTDEESAIEAGLWREKLYVADTEPIPGARVLSPGGSTGLLPGYKGGGRDAWGLYLPAETTPGAGNASPSPDFRSPPTNAETTNRRIPFGWATVPGATGYQFQLASDTAFTSPLIDTVVTDGMFVPTSDLPDGSYFYRARARLGDGGYSGYSLVDQVTIVPGSLASAPEESTTLAITPLLQHKDSNMICIDGEPFISGHNRTGTDRWDSAHEDDDDWEVGNGTPLRKNLHDEHYCTRASIAMIVSYYGGKLSQDRISYHKYGGGDLEGDLGHGLGLWPDELCTTGNGVIGEDDVFTWAMNGDKNECGTEEPSYNQIKGWIDAQRPVLLVVNKGNGVGHSVVVSGYTKSGEFVQVIDPLTASASWIKYSPLTIAEYHCPEGKKTPLSNEGDLTTDFDEDGLINFDEKNRLDTSELLADTDKDGVGDKEDLAEVYFSDTTDRRTNRPDGPDVDGDGLRKEVDEDNDGGGALDGCEDTDGDGRYEKEAGETSNFYASDDVPCIPFVDDVYTTNYEENLKTTFRPGEAIVLVIKANNTMTADQAVKFTWDTRSPTGQPVGHLSLADYATIVKTGTDTIWIDRGIAKSQAEGTYTFTGSLAYQSRESSDSSTFKVRGSPIAIDLARALTCKDVEDTLFVDETDTFTLSDSKVVVWTAWEGAWGSHTAKYDWYWPDGTLWFTYSQLFTSAEALYKTWCYFEGGLWKTGTYSVKVYLDGTYVVNVNFTATASGQASPAVAPQPVAVGGGGGAGEPVPQAP